MMLHTYDSLSLIGNDTFMLVVVFMMVHAYEDSHIDNIPVMLSWEGTFLGCFLHYASLVISSFLIGA